MDELQTDRVCSEKKILMLGDIRGGTIRKGSQQERPTPRIMAIVLAALCSLRTLGLF